ncbi:hypothetical protein HZY62_09340 [Maribacter polysiphoniae]|uniref:Uncharacterized protein n=1 Tax=Maribacter polysiphoniae TaxID=429344 RepID=A0A316E344_9FLAO|nr:hypothetical protein [Maribacter polysiphoniae]MBD1260788.1 hypothetical protein [Maribacter polysiphoniae]PWK24078.1 hypothetical protein LX92_01664 [Maribacter polysiphoniae]
MEKDKLKELFNGLEGTFDTGEPKAGHQERFLEKLNQANKTITLHKKKGNWWRPLSIAASVAVISLLAIGIYTSWPSLDEQVAQISPEVSNTQVYFASLIEDQVKQLEKESSPETQKIISDTMDQLKKLETNYKQLETDLINGGNNKLILSAMITNFQTRIDLLQDVINQIETIKNLKNQNDANFII